MKVMVILIVIGSHGTILKELVKRLEDLEKKEQLEAIQTTALRSARKVRRVLEICSHSNSTEKPSANAGMKNSQKNEIIIIIHCK